MNVKPGLEGAGSVQIIRNLMDGEACLHSIWTVVMYSTRTTGSDSFEAHHV